MIQGIDRSETVQPRLLGIKELQTYTGLGITRAAEMGAAAGAVRRYGKRVLYDRSKIDAYIDSEMQEV